MRALRRPSWPSLALALGAALLLIAVGLYVAPSDQYILLPDDARALDPLVVVRGEKPNEDAGGVYYVAVSARKASVLEKLFPGIEEGSTLVPEHVFNPAGVNEGVRRQGELREMRRSQRYAAAVALKELGLRVEIEPVGAAVVQTIKGFPAAAKLRARDLIVAIDGRRVTIPDNLTRALSQHAPGDTVRLQVRRGGLTREVAIRTVRNPDSRVTTPFLGVELKDPEVTLPFPVTFDLGQVGGPSAGLAFALDLLEELGRDVDRGRRVAATGEIRLDGSLHAVGGLKQKTIGARRSGMDLFLVPGENAVEARRYADGLRIVPVDSFQQALQVLATGRIGA